MVYEKVSNLELVLSRKRSVKDNTPTAIGGVPVEEDVAPDAGTDPGRGEEDHGSQEPDGDADDLHFDKQDKHVPNGDYPVVIDVKCGVPPTNVQLEFFLGEPSNIHRKGPEAKYATEYLRCAPIDSFDTANPQKMKRSMLRLEEHVTSLTPDAVNAMSLQQERFFKKCMKQIWIHILRKARSSRMMEMPRRVNKRIMKLYIHA